MPDETRKGRSLIRASLDIAADQWTLLVLRELYIGARQWSDFTAWLNIPPATLNQRLKQLVKTGCVAKHSVAGSRGSAYQLTEKGVDRFAFQMAAREWQLRWHPRGGAFVTPWVHECGAALRCKTVCHACGTEPKPDEIQFVERSVLLRETGTQPQPRRLSSLMGTDGRSTGMQPPRIVELLGDRCATTMLAAMMRGHQKFEEIATWSGLSPATVAQRLKKLQVMGLIYSRLYQQRPDRYEYLLSPAGWDLLAVTLQLYRWAERWLTQERQPFATHILCGQPLVADLLCQHCGGLVHLGNTRLATRDLQPEQSYDCNSREDTPPAPQPMAT